MKFTRLSYREVERRRHASVAALKQRDRAEFDQWYQELCDREYWTRGQCCAGCDYWQSDMGGIGGCAAAGIVSGDQVMASIGVSFCSYTPPPGLPLTKLHFWCGKFKDDFDWPSLDVDYLRHIGAAEKVARGHRPLAPSHAQ